MLHEKSCGAVLFTTEKGIKKFLLVESNYFGFPKGHVEENETEQETALREIKEETGVDATIIPGFRERSITGCRTETSRRLFSLLRSTRRSSTRSTEPSCGESPC